MTFGMRGALCNLFVAQAVVDVVNGRDQGLQGAIAAALRGESEGRFQEFVNVCVTSFIDTHIPFLLLTLALHSSCHQIEQVF